MFSCNINNNLFFAVFLKVAAYLKKFIGFKSVSYKNKKHSMHDLFKIICKSALLYDKD